MLERDAARAASGHAMVRWSAVVGIKGSRLRLG
jgi:hypothetical protein